MSEETPKHEHTKTNSCSDMCKKYPHAILIGSIIAALIIGYALGAHNGVGRYYGKKMHDKGGYDRWEKQDMYKKDDMQKPIDKVMPQETPPETTNTGEITPPAPTGTSTQN